MKLTNLLIGFTLSAVSIVYAQEQTEQERECDRMRFLAGKELEIKNFAGASTYYLLGEKICGGYDKANYDRLIGTLRNTISGETDKARIAAYVDTVTTAYDRAEAAGHYDQSNDFARATYEMQKPKPDRAKIDLLYKRGIEREKTKTNEAYVAYYYYNLYMIYAEVPAEKRPEMKKRLITEYFALTQLIGEAKMSVKTQENLTTYFNYVVKACDDVLPELPSFMSNLPQEIEAKKLTVKNFITLLETKECTGSKEYEMLIDTLVKIDPSFEGILAKAKLLISKKRYSEAISTLKEARTMTDDAEQKEEVDYMIVTVQFNSGQYTTAYNSALHINGKHKGEALKMAAQSVAQNANNCGSSTFERKCNYYYAVELLERAQASGASVGSLLATYKAKFPTDEEIFIENKAKGQSVTLSCYGVSVTIR